MSALFQSRPFITPSIFFYFLGLNYSVTRLLALHKTHDVLHLQSGNSIEIRHHCQAKTQILKCLDIYRWFFVIPTYGRLTNRIKYLFTQQLGGKTNRLI